MKQILRIKAVSQCIGIRRASLTYIEYKDGIYDLSFLEHPLNKFRTINISNGLVNGKIITSGEEIYFNTNNKVKTLNGEETETIVLGILLLDLDYDMLDFYLNAISNNQKFDQWNGEIEYIIGLMYLLDKNDKSNANIWFEKAHDKGFKYELLKVK